MISFIGYLALRRYEESPVGDLARDVMDAAELGWDDPTLSCVQPLREPSDLGDLVEQLSHLGPAVLEAAAIAWLGYRRYNQLHLREAA